MDFFESQSIARKRTAVLVGYFFLALLIVIPLLYLLLLGVAVPLRGVVNFFGDTFDLEGTYKPIPHPGWWDPNLATWVAGLILVGMVGGTLFRLIQVARGGAVVAKFLGGTRVEPGTKEADEKRVLNVVEEMAIASGLPVPDLYILKRERAINAFAAGLTRSDTVIAVTQGCVDALTRDELQAVIAHEFSHILYGDTRLKTILVGLLHGLMFPAVLSNRASHAAAEGDAFRTTLAVFGFLVLWPITVPLFLVCQLGSALAMLIKRKVSQQREFLADAAAVQFTRSAESVAGALKKVGGYGAGSCVLSSGAREASHFFFANAMGRRVSRTSLFSTHPPLTERVRRIDPSFAGEFEPVLSEQARQQASAAREPEAEPTMPGERFGVDTGRAVGSIGNFDAGHLTLAATLLAAIPAGLARSARDSLGARCVIYALLLGRDETVRKAQLETLRRSTGPDVHTQTQQAMMALSYMKTDRRLTLTLIAVRSLRTLVREEYVRFQRNVETLIQADAKVDLFEFVLQRMIIRHLKPLFERRVVDSLPMPYAKLPSLLSACRTLLSCLARWGTYEALDRAEAFQKGMAGLGVQAASDLLPEEECTVAAVDSALDRIARGDTEARKRVVDACVACIAADQWVTVPEAELLQAVADSLDCPMPPLTPGQTDDARPPLEIGK